MSESRGVSTTANPYTHTPGPWKVVTERVSPFYHGLIAYIESNPDRCLSVVAETGRPVLQTSANASLIAVAPDLLEACKEALHAISEELRAAGPEEVKQHPILRAHATTADKLRATIAKAEGR